MKTLVIVAHPNLSASRNNRCLVEELRRHPNICVRELYSEYPDWVIDVAREQELLLRHERIVFQFPLYWYSTPPLLKKWQDDVLTHGWAYGSKGTKLHGKELRIVTSIGGSLDVYQAGGRNHFSMSEILRPLQATANICGMHYLPAKVVEGGLDDEQLTEVAKEYAQEIQEA